MIVINRLGQHYKGPGMQRATGATKTVLHWEMFPNVSITDWEAVDMRWETS